MALTLHGTVSDNTVALDRKTATPLIINGDMQIAQRSTSATGKTGIGYHSLDRFLTVITSMGTWTQSQSTDVPTGQGFSSSLKMDCTTAKTSPDSNSALILIQRIEGQNLQMLKYGGASAETITLSFWVKSAKTGTYIIELDQNGNSKDYSQSYTINSANTWEKKVMTFSGDTASSLANDNTQQLEINFWLGAGSDYSSGTLNTSWASTTNANRAVGNVNLADSTSNDWYITGIQMEVGTFDVNSIPPFQFEDRATSLARCQRYYFKMSSAESFGPYGMGHGVNSTTFRVIINTPVTMRAQPTLSFSTASNFIWSFGNALTGISSAEYSTDAFSVNCVTTGITFKEAYLLTAGNNSNSYIEASSEL